MLVNSWVIIDRSTNTPVCEFYNPELVHKVNTKKYYTMSTLEWLQFFNTEIKKNRD
jgi:hypothetical protein